MKNILKLSIVSLLLGLIYVFSSNVSAWFVSYGQAVITIADIDDPFIMELLYPIEEAPVLTNQEMDALLTDEFYVPSFMSSMNGYIDADDYGSSQLYGEGELYRSDNGNNVFSIDFESDRPSNYKIALIFEDGTIISSSIITQTLFKATISFDGAAVSFSESGPDEIRIPLYERDFSFYLNRILLSIVFVIAMLSVELLIAFHFGYRGKRTAFILFGLYAVYYLLSFLIQWTREETMFMQFSLYLPYLTIMFVILLTAIQFKVWAIRYPQQSQLKTLIYVIFGNAALIAFSIYGFYVTGGIF